VQNLLILDVTPLSLGLETIKEMMIVLNPMDTIFDATHLIGRRVSDPTVQNDMNFCPFKVIYGPAKKPMIVVTYKREEK